MGGKYNFPRQMRAVQYLLRSHTPGLAADGSFGPKTAAAVSRMQAAHGLARTGRISNGKDWLALFDQQVKYGSRGDAVRAAQVLLFQTVDGSFGQATHRAAVNHQVGHNTLSPGYFSSTSGIVGQRTWVSFFAAVQ